MEEEMDDENGLDRARLDRIEKQVQELAGVTFDIKEQISKISEVISSNRLGDAASRRYMSEIPEERGNPWALQAASGLRYALDNDVVQLQKSPYGPYHETLTALKDATDGRTAEEVSEITKRRRNTESGYLYRLHLAGLVTREKRGREVVYGLKEEVANSVFGE